MTEPIPIQAKRPVLLMLNGFRQNGWSQISLILRTPSKTVLWALTLMLKATRNLALIKPKLDIEPIQPAALAVVSRLTLDAQVSGPCSPSPAVATVTPIRPVKRKTTVVAHTPTGLPAWDVRVKRSKAIRKSQGAVEQLPTSYSALYTKSNVNALRAAKSKILTAKTVT